MTSFNPVDGTIIEKIHFVPHSYETFDSMFKEQIAKDAYDSYVTWYDQTNDVEFFKILYMSDGLKVVGLLAQPKPLDLHKKYPLIMYNRGGTQESGKVTVRELKDDIYPFVKKGYVVLATQYRGNDGGEGRDEVGGADIADVLNLLKVAQHFNYIDTHNSFMYGLSRGGMMTYLAIKHKMPLNAAATVSGVADLFTFVKHRPEAEENLLFKVLPRMPSHRQEEYEKRSAVCWADQLDVPLLMIHSVNDEIVNIEESQNLVRELKASDKVVEFVTYPDGNHTLDKHKTEILKKVDEWFSRYKR